MALINVSSGNGSFLDIIKYDARAGRIFRVDRDANGSTPIDITKTFKAVFDFESVEIGWMRFATGVADFVMVPFGQALPEKPSDEHRQGVRMHVKLAAGCGGDIREFAGTAQVWLRAINELHDLYLGGVAANPGKLPVVVLADTLMVETGGGAKRSTNYQPVWQIQNWVNRPADMPLVAASAKQAPTNGHARPASPGSTKVDPPAAKPAPPPAEAEDFG